MKQKLFHTTIRGRSFTASAALTLLLALGKVAAQSAPDPLLHGFQDPPNSARPRVWWHWMNGNISKRGIQLDLEWMHRIGLGGFQTFDAALATPQVVKQRLLYMTPDWQDAFRYATSLADQYGLEESIASSPGWSEAGGPWVPPSQAMKKYVWSETLVEGGRPFSGQLAHPPSCSGPFQDAGIHSHLITPETTRGTQELYADVAVVAYRRPPQDKQVLSLKPLITASFGTPDATILTDGHLDRTTRLAIPTLAGDSAWIQYQFPQPETMRSLTIAVEKLDDPAARAAGISDPVASLLSSDDGVHFRDIARLPNNNGPETTISFPGVRARYFRINLTRVPSSSPASIRRSRAASPAGTSPGWYEIAELNLRPGVRVNHFEEKAAFLPVPGGGVPDLYKLPTPDATPGELVPSGDVIDITAMLHPDGTLDWTPPPGNWVVLRIGYSLLGITNHPAPAEATGLEVDKLNAGYVKNYMDQYLDAYEKTVGPEMIGRRGIRSVVTDSWEAGSQNWTDDMIAQFRTRRGYDPAPWMPVLTGIVVASSTESDRFLWDFRKTIADLIAEKFYGQVEASLKARGMIHFGESHESGRAYVADGMEVKKLDDVPMGAMWAQAPGIDNVKYDYNADDRESASVAHIYGQNLVAAESMTASIAPWGWSPATLKPTADQEFLNGINLFAIHESAHQPLAGPRTAPGLTLGPYGQWFNRNETWADQAGAWVSYLARTSYLLQQGRFAADIVYFYGEDSNLTAIFHDKSPNVPFGYAFDYINADGLIHDLTVADGLLTTPGSMAYRVLALDPYSRHMSLPVLRAIYKLVEAGATVIGPKPLDDPSLADNPAEFLRLNLALFGDGSGTHHIGHGTVYAGQQMIDVLARLKIAKDFEHSTPAADTNIAFVHRKLADGDLYFVDNRNNRIENVTATFRVSGYAPEIWFAETGKVEPASYKIDAGQTTVPLSLGPWGTAFVVFRHPTSVTSRALPATNEVPLIEVRGPWQLSFPPDLGAPSRTTLNQLSSWSDNPDMGIKYFSGTATYKVTVNAMPDWFGNGAHLWIDLGDVRNLADISINGQDLGIVWHAPYKVDATSALKPGPNEVTIKVTNSWVNRLIGDQQQGAERYTSSGIKPYRQDSPLLPSGLLGPIRIFSISQSAVGQVPPDK